MRSNGDRCDYDSECFFVRHAYFTGAVTAARVARVRQIAGCGATGPCHCSRESPVPDRQLRAGTGDGR